MNTSLLRSIQMHGKRLSLAIYLSIVCAAQAAANANVLVLDDSQGSTGIRVAFESDGTVANGMLPAGKGKLKFWIDNKPIKVMIFKNQIFNSEDGFDVKVPNNGALQVEALATPISGCGYRWVGGASIELDSDAKIVDFQKLDVNLTISKGTTITLTDPLVATRKIKFENPNNAAGVVFEANWKADGSNSRLNAPLQLLEFHQDGTLKASGVLNVTNVRLPGILIHTGVFNFDVTRPAGGPTDLNWNCPSATATLKFPDGQGDGVKFSVTGLSVNADNEVTFANAQLAAPVEIEMVEPLDFKIKFTNATAKMTNSVLDSLNITGATLTLPDEYSASKTANVPVTFGVTFTYQKLSNGFTGTVQSNQPINIHWKGFRLEIPQASTLFVDFDSQARAQGMPAQLDFGTLVAIPNSWKGIYLSAAKLYLPDNLQQTPGQGSINVTNFLVDGGGVCGKVDVGTGGNGFRVPYFSNSVIDKVFLTFYKNKVTDFSAAGRVNIQDFGTEFAVEVGYSNAGVFTIGIDPQSDIVLAGFDNKVKLSVDQGTYVWSNGAHSISLTGALSIQDGAANGVLKELNGTNLQFNNLAINGSGQLNLGAVLLDLPTPVHKEVGPVSFTLNQIGFGGTWGDANNPFYVEISGDVSVADLPVSGGIGFDGLKIISGSPPKLDWGTIDIDLSIDNVGSLSVEITKGDFPNSGTNLPSGARPYTWTANDNPINVVKGTGTLSLDCLPALGTIEVSFLASKHSWYAGANVGLPSPIPLGQTGLSLFAFRGGVGRNVVGVKKTDYSQQEMMGVPMVDYDLIPRSPSSTAQPNWLFVAGATLGTADHFTAWGDLTLTAGIGATFFINLNGKLYLLEPASGNPPVDRVIVGNLLYDSSVPKFQANLAADLYFPAKQTYTNGTGIRVSGGMELMLSPNQKYIRVGGTPTFTFNDWNPPTFTNPVQLVVRVAGKDLFQAQAAFEASLNRLQTGAQVLNVYAAAAVTMGIAFSHDGKIFDASASGSIYGWLKAAGQYTFATSSSPGQFGGATVQVLIGGQITGSISIGRLSGSAGIQLELGAMASLNSNWKLSLSGHVDASFYFSGKWRDFKIAVNI